MNHKEIMQEIRSLMESPGTCSTEAFEILYRQKCLYLLSRVKNPPPSYSHCLITNQMIQEYRYLCCKNIFYELRDIPYAVIKGAALSNSIYGKPFFRLSGDIDILVSFNNIARVTKILMDNGFVQGRVIDDEIRSSSREEKIYYRVYTHQLASFQKKSDFLLSPFITIDINFDILWGESTQKIDIEDLLLHTETISIYNVNIKKLSPIYEFISMCLHHYKDMNSIYLLYKKGYSLYEFVDIYYYLINKKIDVRSLKKITQQYNVTRYIYYCIYYTNELFGDIRLKEYLEMLETEDGMKLINCFGLNKDEKHIWTIPFLERVIGDDFQKQFEKQLSYADFRKIEINSKYILAKQTDG